MKRWLLLVLIALTACTASAAKASLSPSPTASPATTPSAPSPSPVAAAACRLPISLGSFPSFQGGFLSYPSGEVTVDPNGVGGRYFDRAFSRWLPVERQAVSADGSHYAYTERATGEGKVSRIHIVDLRSGEDRAFDTPSSNWFIPYVPLAYLSDGVYLGQAWESPMVGLWRLDPIRGALTRVVQIFDIEVLGSAQVLWVGTVNPADPNPLQGFQTIANQIDRLNLADGSRTAWLYRPGMAVYGVGTDTGGHPIVRVFAGKDGFFRPELDGELLILLDERTQKSIYKGSELQFFSSSIADSVGIWFGGPQGIYLYSERAGFQKISGQAGYPAGSCQ